MKTYSEIIGDGGSKIVEQVTEKMAQLEKRMSHIRYKVAVLSGKGGVGKSTITVNMAAAMADYGYKVGILDADLNGPTIPNLLGLEKVNLKVNGESVVPPTTFSGIKVMSTELFSSSHEAPVSWKGPSATYPWLSAIEATALRELLADTDWGELDFLFFDLPPVISRINDLIGFLPELNGAILVTIPSEISHIILLKTISSVKKLKIPILGVIENMKGFTCSHCGQQNSLFTDQDIQEAFEYMGLPYLGNIPFDKNINYLLKSRIKETGEIKTQSTVHETFTDVCSNLLRILEL